MSAPIDPQREPSANARAAAAGLREYYVALVREGFTEPQALQILGVVLAAAISNPPPPI